MSKGTIKGYGKVDFDPMNYENNVYDLFIIAIVDPGSENVKEEEHYTTESEFNSAIKNTYGRELIERRDFWPDYPYCEVWYNGECYECEQMLHVAYVVDHDED